MPAIMDSEALMDIEAPTTPPRRQASPDMIQFSPMPREEVVIDVEAPKTPPPRQASPDMIQFSPMPREEVGMDVEAPTTPVPRQASPDMIMFSPRPTAAAPTTTSKHAASSPAASPGRAKMRELATGTRIPVAIKTMKTMTTTTTTVTTTTTTTETDCDVVMTQPEALSDSVLDEYRLKLHDIDRQIELKWQAYWELSRQMGEMIARHLQ